VRKPHHKKKKASTDCYSQIKLQRATGYQGLPGLARLCLRRTHRPGRSQQLAPGSGQRRRSPTRCFLSLATLEYCPCARQTALGSPRFVAVRAEEARGGVIGSMMMQLVDELVNGRQTSTRLVAAEARGLEF
jgi:hypothetical protein